MPLLELCLLFFQAFLMWRVAISKEWKKRDTQANRIKVWYFTTAVCAVLTVAIIALTMTTDIVGMVDIRVRQALMVILTLYTYSVYQAVHIANSSRDASSK